ncbi:hypothetical protein WME90_46430 [Sorangium sp. So ce375]|uniref:hypothetical protein n=1 Tax=Sorangium sp. So ce375 TaxID=3133306 RepID=UPI003F5C29D7
MTKGQVVKGQLECNSAVWRSRPDGSELELLAWGIRNPFGLAFGEDGHLYATDNDFEEKGERAIGEDPDRIWRIKNARVPPGEVKEPEWFGYPDLCGDGLPAWHELHRPNRGKAAEPFLKDPPPWAGPAAFLFPPHTALGKLTVSRSDAFGFRGHAFVCQFGTYAPLNTNREAALGRGFQVVRCDIAAGTGEPFLRNRAPGPASGTPGSGGIERPVDCVFSPDGKSLYVLDFGNNTATRSYVVAYAHTGVIWRVTRRGTGLLLADSALPEASRALRRATAARGRSRKSPHSLASSKAPSASPRADERRPRRLGPPLTTCRSITPTGVRPRRRRGVAGT